jgi:hypothetical protein
VRATLASVDAAAVARAEAFLAASARPCTYFDSARVANLPLQRGFLGRLLGKPCATPQLPVLASKFGGRPYVTASDLPWPEIKGFLVQINLAELPHLAEMPPRGLLAVDLLSSFKDPWAYAIRFYADPREEAAEDPGRVRCVGNYEARLQFTPGLSYPQGDVWESAVGIQDAGVRELWDEWQFEVGHPPRVRTEEWHRILGHPAEGFRELYGFRPPAGRPDSIDAYEMLVRLQWDNAADFGWGSNTAYLAIHREDLKEGRLDRAVLCSANV